MTEKVRTIYQDLNEKLLIEQEIAEWEKALREASSYDGKLYAKYKLREIRK